MIKSKHAEMPRRIWSYREPRTVDVMTAWISEIGPESLEAVSLMGHLVLYQYGGQKAIDSIIEDIGDDLHVFGPFVQRAEPPALIFCLGPFSDLELTFLQGGVWRDGVIRPHSARGAALENLEALRADPTRRIQWTS